MINITKYDIVLANLDPTTGSEQKGTRPCLIVQNNLANKNGNTSVICPFTTTLRYYPNCIIVSPSKENGLRKECRLEILQIKTIDKTRIMKKIGILEEKYKPEFHEKFTISFDINDMF